MSRPIHITSPGCETAPKAEMTSLFPFYTAQRIYLIPINCGLERFTRYDFDMSVRAGVSDIDIKVAIYAQVARLASSGVTAIKIDNTEVTSNGITADFQTVALGATKTLQPGSYWVAFIFDDNSGTSQVGSYNTIRSPFAIFTGSYMYNDPGSFTLPATINGSSLAHLFESVGEQPFYAAITEASSASLA